jgi:hypothetical protein
MITILMFIPFFADEPSERVFKAALRKPCGKVSIVRRLNSGGTFAEISQGAAYSALDNPFFGG